MAKYKSNRKFAIFYVVFALFALYALSLMLPFVWAFMTTFKTEAEYINNKTYFPKIVDWTNYIDAFKTLSANNTNMFFMLLNSIWKHDSCGVCLYDDGLRDCEIQILRATADLRHCAVYHDASHHRLAPFAVYRVQRDRDS